ncbi:ATP-dependent metallopeptidase FtsH/Yme1/Tma family protein [Hydrogenimonas cancrithermarum]|uniref:ATPase AAA n=1 Tax=Hydrogenimonas cancrithermarum TaxID=2993563 RepID=A0ABM8FJX7_9BACT|nr:ATP-dependent metallopeptidase FtsH/Yme1/Tma family protein [Hydrogenimonas cancrithermarum]BDY11950.1 ATPase AAA [Hydrogenimonas cancrithermarum]
MEVSKKNRIILIVSALLVVVILAVAYLRDRSKTIDAQTAENLIRNSLVTDAVIDGPYLYFKSGGTLYKVPKDAVNLKELYNTTAVTIKEPNPYIVDLVTIGVLVLLVLYLLRWARKNRELKEQQLSEQIQFANELQKPADIQPIISNITFDDVAGIDDVKEELEEIIDFLKHPQKYRNFGIRMPRGVLLVGPPGVGKTLIAKAVAGEAGVPFFYQSGASFVQIYVGMGAKRVRELFKRAKAMAPAIVFIDEIDAVGKARGGMRNDEREATLNQLLTEMDGFEDSSGIIVIAATNKIEMLDDALLRPGRFDRRVFVSLPNKEERKSILKIYLANKPHYLDLDEIAQMTVGFSGAALSSLVNEAAIHALKNGKKIIETEDFLAVKDKVLLGKRKILTYSDEEKKIQAAYQAAKAVTAYWLDVDFDKIGLLSDHFQNSEKEIVSKTEILNRIKVYLSGDTMMHLHFHEHFTNAANDLKEARLLAQDMVELYGMGERFNADITDIEKILEDARLDVDGFVARMEEGILRLADEILRREMVTKEDVKEILHDLF